MSSIKLKLHCHKTELLLIAMLLPTDLCSFKGDLKTYLFKSLFLSSLLFVMLDLIFSFLFDLDVQALRTFGSCALY